jgi:hypothetical protein
MKLYSPFAILALLHLAWNKRKKFLKIPFKKKNQSCNFA